MIKKFEAFNDIDPYGEEDWYDENEFRVGDKVICVEPVPYWGIYKNEIYEIKDFYPDGHNKHIYLKNHDKAFSINRFKKIKNIHENDEFYEFEDEIDDMVDDSLKINDRVIYNGEEGSYPTEYEGMKGRVVGIYKDKNSKKIMGYDVLFEELGIFHIATFGLHWSEFFEKIN